ncbi:MAG TPA: hypothetical protein VKA61_09900 [Sphingomicrobium sp.]|nr:hypothetical protein [Sphingomicrobium sp.]
MDLPAPLAWLVDEAGASPSPDQFLAELGGRLVADGLPLAGGALTLAVPHPIIARRTWLWRAETGAVIEALGFAGGTLSQAGRDWLAGLGPVQEDTIGPGLDSPVLGWAGIRPFGPAEATRLRQAARFVAAPLAALAARAAMAALLEAYLGRRSAARVQAGALRRGTGETIRAALLYADLRDFTALSETTEPDVAGAAGRTRAARHRGALHRPHPAGCRTRRVYRAMSRRSASGPACGSFNLVPPSSSKPHPFRRWIATQSISRSRSSASATCFNVIFSDGLRRGSGVFESSIAS